MSNSTSSLKSSWQCDSSVEIKACSLEFSISNFSRRFLGTGMHLSSSEFYSKNAPEIRWSLLVYVNGYEEETKGFVSVFLLRSSGTNLVLSIEAGISVLDENRQKECSFSSKCALQINDLTWGCHKFGERDVVKDSLLPNDKLTLFCDLSFFEEVQTSGHSHLMNSWNETLGVKPLDKKALCDIAFKFGDKEIKAHRAVLATVSPVFEAMFKNEMAERDNDVIEITDITFEVFNEMITFIYTGKFDDCHHLIEELLFISDKYDIETLKNICEKLLCNSLVPENVLDILILSDTCSCSFLKSKTVAFICDNGLIVNETELCKLVKIFQNNNSLLLSLLDIAIGHEVTKDLCANNK